MTFEDHVIIDMVPKDISLASALVSSRKKNL